MCLLNCIRIHGRESCAKSSQTYDSQLGLRRQELQLLILSVSEKKRKVKAPSPDDPTPSDIAEYEENRKYLQKVYKSQKWSEVGIAVVYA